VSMTLRLAMLSILIGAILGVIIFAAAAAAGRDRKLPFWLSGAVWGTLTAVLALSDCLHTTGTGLISGAAFSIFFGGLLLFPVIMAWRQRYWGLRWLFAQCVVALCIGPMFAAAVVAAACTLS
jgi:hypothetical protein